MATDRYGILVPMEDTTAMTKSVRSVNVLVRLDFVGHDVSNQSIQDALDEMDYNFSYEDDFVKIVNTEIIDTFVAERRDET